MDRARAAMIEANMPTELWPFAVQTAALITNLLLGKMNEGLILRKEENYEGPTGGLYTAKSSLGLREDIIQR